MENKKLIKINHFLIACLFICQPLIVMFQATVVRDVQLFGFSIFEFFNIALALISMVLCLLTYPQKKTFIKYIPYIVMLGLYFIFHGINIYGFNHSVYLNQSPSFLVESYYIFRTFIVPLLLLFDICYSQLKKEELLRILEVFIFIISIVCVVTNIFKVAQINYFFDGTAYNTESIFDWFSFSNSSRYSYYNLTTKGWFLSGNQLSGILFMSYPIMLYRAYKKKDIFHYILAILQNLSMFMLGTKIANFGSVLIIVMFLVIWVLFKVLKHKETSIIFVLVLGISFGALFPYSPVGYYMSYKEESNGENLVENDTLLEQVIHIDKQDNSVFDYEKLIEESILFQNLDSENLSSEEQKFVFDYLYEFCSFFGIMPVIVDNYNSLNNAEFWVRYIQQTPDNDYRVLKSMILQDIFENDNRTSNKLFGLGYTLNYIYTEADYSYQYYLYGIFGVLLFIGPYFGLLMYIIYKGLTNFKLMFTLESAIYFIAPVLGLLAAKFSGHILERAFPLMVLAWLLGILLIHTNAITSKEELIGG